MNDAEQVSMHSNAEWTAEVTASCGDIVVGMDHIAIAVEDLQAAIDWYVTKLGFILLERRLTRGARTGMESAVMKAGSAFIVLIQGTSDKSQVSRFIQEFGPGVQHVALEVTDLDVALNRVGAAGGAAVTNVIRGDGVRQVFLRRDAGSGVRIELIERRGGTFSDETVQELFRKFESDDLY